MKDFNIKIKMKSPVVLNVEFVKDMFESSRLESFPISIKFNPKTQSSTFTLHITEDDLKNKEEIIQQIKNDLGIEDDED